MTNNNICENIKYKKNITLYHVDVNLRETLKRGYLGGNRVLYCSIKPSSLLEVVKGWKSEKVEAAVFKLDNIPINSLYIDWEPWWMADFLLDEITDEAIYIYKRILDIKFSTAGRPVPLRDIYLLCKELGEKKMIDNELTWIYIKKGSRIRVSEDDIIERYSFP